MLVTLRTNVLAHTLNTYVLYIIYIILVISCMCLHALNMYTCIKYAYMHIYIHDIAIILICMLCVHKSVFNVWFWWTADMSVLCYIDSIVILYFKPCNMHEPRTTHQPRWVMSDLDLPIINPLPCKWIVTLWTCCFKASLNGSNLKWMVCGLIFPKAWFWVSLVFEDNLIYIPSHFCRLQMLFKAHEESVSVAWPTAWANAAVGGVVERGQFLDGAVYSPWQTWKPAYQQVALKHNVFKYLNQVPKGSLAMIAKTLYTWL